MERLRLRYKSDLSDGKWKMIEAIFKRRKKGKDLQKHVKRELLNGVFYIRPPAKLKKYAILMK